MDEPTPTTSRLESLIRSWPKPSFPASASGCFCTPAPSPACATSGPTRPSRSRPPGERRQPMSKDKKMLQREKKAFEDAILADRYDGDTRQVFADWLEENGYDDEAVIQR